MCLVSRRRCCDIWITDWCRMYHLRRFDRMSRFLDRMSKDCDVMSPKPYYAISFRCFFWLLNFFCVKSWRPHGHHTSQNFDRMSKFLWPHVHKTILCDFFLVFFFGYSFFFCNFLATARPPHVSKFWPHVPIFGPYVQKWWPHVPKTIIYDFFLLFFLVTEFFLCNVLATSRPPYVSKSWPHVQIFVTSCPQNNIMRFFFGVFFLVTHFFFVMSWPPHGHHTSQNFDRMSQFLDRMSKNGDLMSPKP
jgi:hypothetical protein